MVYIPLTLQPQQFPNYNEILVYGTTTQDDFGLYEVGLRAANLLTQRNIPSQLDFTVVPPGKFIIKYAYNIMMGCSIISHIQLMLTPQLPTVLLQL